MRIRARYLVPLLCGLAIVPLGLWHSSRQLAAERLERWQQRTDAHDAADELSKFVEVPGGGITLSDLRTFIQERTNLKVEFDDSLTTGMPLCAPRDDVAGTLPARVAVEDWKVEMPEGRFRLRTALAAALHRHGWTYDLEDDNRLIVTTERISRDFGHRYVETYPLPQPELASSDADERSWADLLMSATGRDQWSDVGGRNHIEPVPGALVVSQTARGHREFRRLLREFLRLESPPSNFTPVPLWPDPADGNVQVFAALDQTASIDWLDRPLDEGLADLARRHKIPIIIRYHKLAEAAVPRTCPVTKQLSGISLGSLLRLMLSELELTYMVEDGTLVITTADDSNWDGRRLVAYPVHDLIGQRPGQDYDPLIQLIHTTVMPYSWDEVGGPSSVHHGSVDGWLLVSQSSEGQERIAFVLSQLRAALKHDPASRTLSLAEDNPREQRIRNALERELDLQYDKLPLRDAAALLSDWLEIPIVLNSKRMEEAGIGTDTPVHLRLPKRPAKKQLSTFLAELELTWLIDDEVLVITTPDDANSPDRQTTRLYDLRLLTDPDLGVAPGDRLIEVVMAMVEPQTWDEVGGPGSLSFFQDILVVSQEEQVHERVERFLAALEQHCTGLPGAAESGAWVINPLADPRDAPIEEALLRPIDFAVHETPLIQALERLAEEQNLPLVVRRLQMMDAAIDITDEIDFSAEEMTIGGVLDRLLEPFEATYVVRDGALIVTSSYGASTSLQPRLYRLPEVRRRVGGASQLKFPFDLLKQLPAISWSHDIGTSITLNEQWAVLSGGQPLHRWVEARLAPEGRLAQWAAERKALDEERMATTNWSELPPGRAITAAQPTDRVLPPASFPLLEDFE